ncbi:MAG TPA: helix-turn-helix domain-containing protein [Stellaceae bacterium]|nr:helix-turn-helix domain-containing protein [Stellaceae bacterium]
MSLAIGTETAVSRTNSILARQVATCASCTLRARSLCSGVPDGEISRLAACATRQHVSAGDVIFDEGEAADNVVTITSGTAKIFKLLPDGRRQITGFLFPGDFAGLALEGSYVYSAEAVTEVNLCRFGRHQLRGLLERFPRMEQNLLRLTVNELSSAQDQMVLLGRKTAAEKIASFLLMLSDRASHRDDEDISLPMTRTDIADYLGLTTETVSRTFTQLRKSGCIKVPDAGSVTVADRERLEGLAAGLN